MAKRNLASMSVDALLKLRADIGKVLGRRASELQDQLSRLGSEIAPSRRGRSSSLKGKRVPIKYRDKSGNTWAGRGAQPTWLREKLEAGAKLENFAVHKAPATRKASPKKSKKRRKTKSRKSKRHVKRRAAPQRQQSRPAPGPKTDLTNRSDGASATAE